MINESSLGDISSDGAGSLVEQGGYANLRTIGRLAGTNNAEIQMLG
jgi:hypothetical protein